ncbi:MAG: hypothetical protein M0D57_18890 [Sphingobacteriales bacterium JAD_PAG50586_3]|nr:MAG: hypothetical protein M0D57_18890 [Sphingobacteriales bacterium JAD_PAG50586_3]
MESTQPEPQKLSTTVFSYILKVWGITFGVASIGYSIFLGGGTLGLNLMALAASIPVMLPVYFSVSYIFSEVKTNTKRKLYISLVLAAAFLGVCILLGMFFGGDREIVTFGLMMGSPHFAVGLIAIWVFKIRI